MNERIAKDLRRLARAKWTALSPELKKIISYRRMYKEIKYEYRNEKG